MADYRAVTAIGEAVIDLLESAYRPSEIDAQLELNQELTFKVYGAGDFLDPMSSGVSLFLYRIFPSGVIRTPPGRIRDDGSRQRSQLPLELHFLLTIWAGKPSLQHALAGWAMRVLEDVPVLSSAVLNGVAPGGFRPDETITFGLAELRTEDLLRIWDVLGVKTYQLSIPYYARIVSLESRYSIPESEAPPVQTRRLELGILEQPERRG